MRRKWASDDDLQLVDLKNRNLGWKEISALANRTPMAVERRFHLLQKLKKAPYKKSEYSARIEEILDFIKKKGHRAALSKYGSYVIHYLKRNKLWKRTLRIVPVYPERFLKHSDRFYWAGFIAADGCIRSKKYLYVGLALKDANHLKKMFKIAGGSFSKRKTHVEWYAHKSEKIIDFLAVLNITPRKTKTLRPPVGLSEEDTRDFIRGYFDGDGCVTCSIQKRGTFVQLFSFLGTIWMLEWVRECLKKWAGCETFPKICESRGISVISYGSKHDFLKLGSWMYRRGERLDRKYERFIQISNIIKN